MIKKLLFFVLQLVVFAGLAQQLYTNQIFDKRIKTVQLVKLGTDDRYPIIELNSSQKLLLTFDILGSETEYFQYTIIHCDAEWNQSRINQNDYISGITFDNLENPKFSTNTLTKYTHYSLVFPNQNLEPKIAGNYIIKVYKNFDEQDVVLTRKVMVLKKSVAIDGMARRATLAEYRYTKQEINFNVNHNNYKILDPYQDVKVAIVQNARWENALTGLKPLFIRENTLEYSSFDQAIFPGGNEFRFFDTRSLRGFSTNVRTKILDSVYLCHLNYDESRGSQQYFFYIDYNGKRIIDNKEGQNPNIDADYSWVTFYLLQLNQLEQDVYVYGEFTDWRLLPNYKMTYNKKRLRYEVDVLLKQGRYEYKFATDNQSAPDETYFEGNHSETENEYLILVYNKNLLYKFDELIGAKIIRSGL